jgi:hypothetical protein
LKKISDLRNSKFPNFRHTSMLVQIPLGAWVLVCEDVVCCTSRWLSSRGLIQIAHVLLSVIRCSIIPQYL